MEDSNTQSDYLRYRGNAVSTAKRPQRKTRRCDWHAVVTYCPMWRQWEPIGGACDKMAVYSIQRQFSFRLCGLENTEN